MPFIENHAKILRILGFPFTPFYAAATRIRNWLYDTWKASSATFPIPVISIGNLCTGGSGKTPMTEYLVRLLGNSYNTTVVSRGYGRRSKGNLLVNEGMNVLQTGDEPLQYFLKFNKKLSKPFYIYLAAKRAEGIQELMTLKPECQIVFLDDAYQHRQVRPSLSILLTEYGKPFFKDHLLPWGNLRESREQSRRADIIIVTKCPSTLSETERERFKADCPLLPKQKLFFSCIRYEMPSSVSRNLAILTGIAHPEPMLEYLKNKGFHILKHFKFGDHHAFSQEDLTRIAAACRNLAQTCPDLCLLTTEKDMARLYGHPSLPLLSGFHLSSLPIRMEFLFNESQEFDSIVQKHVKRNSGLPPYDKWEY